MTVLVDTDWIVAFLHRADGRHSDAQKVAPQVFAGRWGAALITDYIVDEALTLLMARGAPLAVVDRLQASFTLLSGKKITQAELMEMLLAAAEASTKPLSEVKWRPATGRELERIMALPMDFGTGEGDVDEVLYGKKRRPRR